MIRTIFNPFGLEPYPKRIAKQKRNIKWFSINFRLLFVLVEKRRSIDELIALSVMQSVLEPGRYGEGSGLAILVHGDVSHLE